MDANLALFRARLMIQEEELEHWQRGWYGFAIRGNTSIQRLRLLKVHEETVQLAL